MFGILEDVCLILFLKEMFPLLDRKEVGRRYFFNGFVRGIVYKCM
jgi:hypothetical protein